jgi:hypothetical protein
MMFGAALIGACLLAAPVDAREGDLHPAFGAGGTASAHWWRFDNLSWRN